MPSSSDYTLAKKILNIQKNMNLITDLDSKNCFNCNTTVIGNDYTTTGQQGPPGPQGAPGDRYLTTFTSTIYKYIMDTGSISFQLESGLAYIHGHHIRCVYDSPSAPYDNFTGTVMSYNDKTGIIIINNISNISDGFTYSTERTYKINIDNYDAQLYTNSQSDSAISISNDNATNSPCYINFIKTTSGNLTNVHTSDGITFSPSNGELSINSISETTNNQTRVNISDLDLAYSTEFITNLAPKKYSIATQPSLDRYGFLAEDITAFYGNIGMVNNNSICYSEIIAPIVSVLQNVLTRLQNAETRISQLENPPVALTAAFSMEPPIVSEVPTTFSMDPDVSETVAIAPNPPENYEDDVNINKFVQMIAEAKKKVLNSYI
jgi:hypothetical protein